MAKLGLFWAVVCAALALAASAFAGGNATLKKPKPYLGTAGAVQSQIQRGAVQGVAVSPRTVGKLPFTGQDLGILTAGGVLLLILGGATRRITRKSSS